MKIIKENAGWALILLLALSAGLLYFFPFSTPVKAILLLVSVLLGLIPMAVHSESGQLSPEEDNVFYLKSREPDFSELLIVAALAVSYGLLRQHSLSFILLMAAVIRAISILAEYTRGSEYPKPYLYLEADAIKRHISGEAEVNLKSLKYAKLTPDSLILYEKWAHHKVVFSKFEEGERLKETLLSRIKALGIELKEEPAVGVA